MTGQRFGHFEVLGLIGSGGMGVVYLARDERLGRRVAIKVLPDGRVADARARARFHREAQALSRLNHPNIATIYDFDQQDGRDLLVMEYIEGRSLRDAGPLPLPPAEVAELGVQLATALVAAHGAGVVHLDLKPGNLMRTSDGRLKILDFGIARLQQNEAAEFTTLTGTVAVAGAVGTPPYMAPEQVMTGPVDHRADIYGAGATLYELATGRRPFERPRGAALYDAILHEAPERPSRHNAAIDPSLDAALLRALGKEPRERQQSAGELLRDLQGCVETMTARGGAPPRRWRRREVLLAGAATLAALTATGYALWPAPARARFHARDFVLIGDVEHPSDPLLSRATREALKISLQQSPFVNVVSGDRVVDTLRRMGRPPGSAVTEAAGLEICQREGIPVLIAGAMTVSGGSTLITIKAIEAGSGALLFAESAEYREPADLFGRLDGLALRVRERLGESIDSISKTSRPLAQATTGSTEALRQYTKAVDARAMGRSAEVEAPLLAALQLDPRFAMAYLKLGDYYLDIAGDADRAFAQIDRAYALRSRVTDRERLFIEAEYFNTHQQFEHERDRLRALTALYPDDPEFLYQLAIAHYALEELPQAIASLRRSLQVNPHGARAHGSLVLFLARNNQPDAALDASRAAEANGVAASSLYWPRGLAFIARSELAQAGRDFRALAEMPGYSRHLGRLQEARLALLHRPLADALPLLQAVVDMLRRDRDVVLEVTARLQLGRARLLAGDRPGAAREVAALQALTASGTTRPNALRDVGALALATGDAVGAKAYVDRLAASPVSVVNDAARLFLAGAIALREGRSGEATRLLDESYGRRPYYQCLLLRAEARAALDDWAGAAAAYAGVLAAKGPIIQDGFTPDLRRAEDGLQRAIAKLPVGREGAR
jgi:tetratricopeptide (TPR) repeat protein